MLHCRDIARWNIVKLLRHNACMKGNSAEPRYIGIHAHRVPGLGVRIPLWALISVLCECCVLSGTGHYGGPISLTEEYYCVCLSVNLK
jgi:hypothetical protein